MTSLANGRTDTFTAVLQTVSNYARWLQVLEPISDAFPMGGLHNTLRRLVVDGRPVATGLLEGTGAPTMIDVREA